MSDVRNTDLGTVLFPVALRSVFLKKVLISDEEIPLRKIPQYKAVVDLEKMKTLSVVSKGYRLVSNEKALKLGSKAFGGGGEKVKRVAV